MNNLSVFIFRRDLRLSDNTALIEALKNSKKVIACFVFNPLQIGKNPYKGRPSINFMFESLLDLEGQMKGNLYFFQGLPHEVLKKLHKITKFDSLYLNREYTPFGIKRDEKIQSVCNKLNTMVSYYDDYLLNSPEDVLKPDHTPYKKFTPYFRTASKQKVREVRKNNFKNYYKEKISFSTNLKKMVKILDYKYDPNFFKGGRKEGLKLLNKLKSLKGYDKERDIPSLNKTGHLSAHNKFGTISIREFYFKIKDTLGIKHSLISQLYWRDFFTNIGFYFPRVIGGCFYEKYNKLPWENDSKFFNAWKKGKTGFPIVDAGMRELNETGFMQNRVRMIVASFLTKDMLIDWRKGEKYFAQHLIDFDPLVNNGNWQWAAGTGCDSVPYFRIFNPWRQQERFDPECKYIKKWIPELKDITPKGIHKLSEELPKGLKYPKPILDHAKAKEITLDLYKTVANS